MRAAIPLGIIAVAGLFLFAQPSSAPHADEAHAATDGSRYSNSRSSADTAAALELKRQQLAAREAAIAIKEQELKNLAATLDARVKELDAAKAALDQSLEARKNVQTAEFQKMLKVYNTLRPAEAAGLLDRLSEAQELEILNQMDQRHLTKLLPLVKPERALRWTRQNLTGK